MNKSKVFGNESKVDVSVDENYLKRLIGLEADEKVVKFISDQVNLSKEENILLSSSTKVTYTNKNSEQIRAVIDLQLLNTQHDLNIHIDSINKKLPDAGIYIGCVETNVERIKKIYAGHILAIASIMMWFDFLIYRILPKLPLTRSIYFEVLRFKYHAVSEAEILGRLTNAGFEVIGHEVVNGVFYYSVMKTSEPQHDKKPSYGIIFKMERIGRNGNSFGVYKVRTMHPYSEFLQKYVVMLNGYNEAGKPNHDFRLTNWGRLIRGLHIDELPQLLNLLKGEMNIVGVRPLSKFGFSALPIDLQNERIKYKPGCIPPNVALGLKGFDGVIEAERIYLEAMKKNPFFTNFKYFWMAIFNLSIGKHLTA